MLTSVSVIISLLTLILISFPIGYLIVNNFLKRRDLKLPFGPLVPLYLSAGTCAQLLISFLVGTSLISSFVPYVVAIISFIIIFFQYLKWNKIHSFSFNRPCYTNTFSLLLLIVVFLYFGSVAGKLQWPPIGDAIFHSSLTSLIIYKGHLATELEPLVKPELSRSFPYPQGFHALAADVSLSLGLNPGESVFLLGIYIISLISTSLFSLAYVLSRSFLISLVPVFSVLYMHTEGSYETWIAAYIWNGPYLQLFAFMAVITLIITLQIWYSKKQSFLRISPIVVIIFLAVFVAYPSYTYHSILIISVYLIIHQLDSRNFIPRFKQMMLFRVFKNRMPVLTSKLVSLNHFINHPEQPRLDLSDNVVMTLANTGTINMNSGRQDNARAPASLLTNYLPIISAAVILIIFAAIMVATDLVDFYYKLISYSVEAIDSSKDKEHFNIGLILSNYLSKPSFAIFTLFSIIGSSLFMLIKSKPIPLIISLYTLIISFLAGINFIYPLRTLPFVITLFVPVTAYIVHEIAAGARAKWIDAGSRRYASIAYYTIVLTFVLVSLYIQAPSVYNQLTARHGWFLSDEGYFEDIYGVATWMKNNVDSEDPILNDRTYSSQYIHGFAINNLTYSYLNGRFTFSNLLSGPEQERMYRELSTIWSDPYYITKVHSLLQKYNVKYIVVSPEGGYPDYKNWGGSGQPIVRKPFSSMEYAEIFDSYPFLKLEYRSGEAFVFSVSSVARNSNFR